MQTALIAAALAVLAALGAAGSVGRFIACRSAAVPEALTTA